MLYHIEHLIHRRQDGSRYQLCITELNVNPGERVALTGPSGSGKSTALDILGMTLHPTSAEAFTFSIGNEEYDINKLWKKNALDKMAYLREHHMGYILQTGELLPFCTVKDNISLTATLSGLDDEETEYTTESLLERLHIEYLRDAMPATLSVGERQRVAVGRALASRPDVVLADEPTAAIDPRMAGEIMSVFLDAVETNNTAVVMVSHDIDLVRHFGFTVYPIQIHANKNGGVVAVLNGTAEQR